MSGYFPELDNKESIPLFGIFEPYTLTDGFCDCKMLDSVTLYDCLTADPRYAELYGDLVAGLPMLGYVEIVCLLVIDWGSFEGGGDSFIFGV